MKKMLSLILALVLVLGLAANVWATEPGIVDEGLVDGVEWRLTEDGNLYLDYDLYDSIGTAPWEKYQELITTITLGGTIYDTIYFDNLPNLTEVHFEKWPRNVGCSFENCPKFTAFTNGREYGNMTCMDGYVVEYGHTIVRTPTGLSGKVVLPEYITNIGLWSFNNCAYIEELIFPEGFKSVGANAFKNCTALKTVVFPSTTNFLFGQIFRGCTSLETIYFTGDAPGIGKSSSHDGGTPFGDVADNRNPKDTRITANVYYPADNETWTEEVRESFGGLVTWIPYNPANPFRDVPLDAFYEESVLWALENNITTGTSATTFGPTGECLRAHVVTFLWRAAGCPEPTSAENPFVDVKEGDFFHKAVLWAVENGITNGIDATHFGPTAPCNRAQVVTFLYRAMQSPAVGTTACPFTDVVAGQWYEPAVLWAVENGITNGLSADTFGVDTTCNRAQVVTFLYRTYVN